VILCTVRA